MAHLAGDVHVRQEVHFDLQYAVAAAGLAPATLGVEGEPAGAVAPCLGVRQRGEQVADIVEQVGIRGGVGAGRAADGTLVDVDDLVQMLLALDGVMPAGVGLHAVQVSAQPLEDDLVDQRAFAAAGHAGNAGQRAQRHGHVDVFQVIFFRAPHRQPFAVAGAAVGGHLNTLLAAEILARQAVGVGHHLLRRSGGHHLSAQRACAGADIDEPVGGTHGVLVMLHHDEGVAQIPEPPQGIQQLVVVPLVQADGGLVQNIQHAHETAADLGSQTDTLALAAGQGAGGAAEGQVAESHRLQKPQTGADLLQNLGGDHLLIARQGQAVEKRDLVVHRHGGGVVDGQAAHSDGQRLRPQPPALTGRTRAGGHEGFDLLLAGVGLGLHIPALQIVGDALEGLMQRSLAPGLVVFQRQLFALGAVEDDILHLAGQLGVGGAEGEIVAFAEGIEVHAGDAVGADGVPAGGHHRAVQNGLALVRDHQRGVHLQLHAKAGAGGACAEGTVEGEQAGRQLLDGHAAVLAGVVLGEGQVLSLPQQIHRHKAAGQVGGGLHAVGQAGGDVGADDQTIHHNVDLMLVVLDQLDLFIQLVHFAVNAGADKAAAPGLLQHPGVLALAATDHRRHYLNTGALGQCHDLVNDLVNGLLADLLAALGAVGHADPRP